MKGNRRSPRHIGINLCEVGSSLELVRGLVHEQVSKDIPILTINLSSQTEDELKVFFEGFKLFDVIHEHKIRVLVLGDWYDTMMVEDIKKIMDLSCDYDSFFLVLCLNYDGREEVVKSLRIIAKRYSQERIGSQDITVELVKEQISSSYFVAPELIIETEQSYCGMLLWDIVGSLIFYDDTLRKKGRIALGDALAFYDKLQN